LYGGREATSFLSRCIEMAEYACEDNEVPSAYDLDLPPRIIKNFEIWWESKDKSIINRRRSLNRFKRPYVSLDSSIGEIFD